MGENVGGDFAQLRLGKGKAGSGHGQEKGWRKGAEIATGYNLNPFAPHFLASFLIMRPDSRHAADFDDDFDDDLPEQPSKSSRKRAMQAVQDLGEELVELGPDRLKKLDLPDNLREAVRACQGFRMEARRRQLQYIGKLMRKIEVEPIRAQLDALRGLSAVAVAQAHQLESLRSRLLADEQVLGEIVAQWPQADLQHLRSLRRNALKEQAAGKAPRAFRELFRALRSLQQGGGGDEGAGTGIEHGDEGLDADDAWEDA
jgi:ribosome-associated protein